MKSKRRKSFTAIAWMLTLAMVLLWAACMGCMTYMRADQIISEESSLFAQRVAERIRTGTPDSAEDFEYKVLDALRLSNDGDYFFEKSSLFSLRSAIMVMDDSGETRWQSQDFLRFQYEIQKDKMTSGRAYEGWAWIDLEEFEELDDRIKAVGPTGEPLWPRHLKITGYFEGTRMIPVKVDCTRPRADDKWWLDGYWQELYVGEADPSKELVTVLTSYPEYHDFQDEREIWYRGVRYDNTLTLLQEGRNGANQWDVTQCVLFDHVRMTGISEDGEPEGLTVSVVAVYYPLLIAMDEMTRDYVITFTLMVMLLLVVLCIIYMKLIRPLNRLNAGFYNSVQLCAQWAETEQLGQRMRELDENLNERNDLLRKKDNELSQMEQQMEYARKNEENRRQMVSGIAHELKTPLAIISCYAEGLQAHIAEEKREQYLENILSETKRMDVLVMEMLELSRLEAGKVTLARDEFDLSAMIQDVFGKLSMEIERKSLHVEIDLGFNNPLYADEGRMEQIVRNLVSNAVRYTPEGGSIRVTTQWTPPTMELRIYNDAERFSKEALEKVWEVFYRTDSARNGKGTGLGLAIVKNLVQLHGGKCSVQNLDQGVEFCIQIPQRY